MKRISAFAHLNGAFPLPEKPYEPEKFHDLPDEKNQVFDFIYAPNSMTGLPQNALGVFLSEDAPEAVRNFVRQQLVDNGGLPTASSEISDSDLEVVCRGRYETTQEYCNRINEFMQGVKDGLEDKVQKWNKIKKTKELEKQGKEV